MGTYGESVEPWHMCRCEGQEDFHTVMPAPALLGKDATYWQSVHQAGQGALLERQEAARKEKEDWQAKASGISKAMLYPVSHLQHFANLHGVCTGLICVSHQPASCVAIHHHGCMVGIAKFQRGKVC